MKLQFLGGAGGVTGSRFLLQAADHRILIDCGLFQGLKELRLKNWEPFPMAPESIDAIVLTHAHLDHSGYIPKLVKEGFRGPIFSTEATRDLCRILLADSAYLQEEEANYRNRKGTTKHQPARPLYTRSDAELSMRQFAPQKLGATFCIGPFEISFRDAGHILGASSVFVKAENKSILFSGDLGRFDDFLMHPPELCPQVNYVVMESTYGDRLHPKNDPVATLSDLIKSVKQNKSILMIPSFAVGRAQSLLYLFHEVFEKDPDLEIPVFVNSPMATNVTEIFKKHQNDHKLNRSECYKVCEVAKFIGSSDESRRLNQQKGPLAIISASGMLTGGRILHHIKEYGGSPKNIILLAGFQAPGTRGQALSSGKKKLKIHGEYCSIEAQVLEINSLSAHADQDELIRWVSPLRNHPPQGIFLVHGDPSASDALRLRLKDELGLHCSIPHLGNVIKL